MPWRAWSADEIRDAVQAALEGNRGYLSEGGERPVLGVPGSVLDRRVFPETDFVRASPFLQTFLANPNHIGCHTRGASEAFFAGTQAIERELLRLCAEEVLHAEPEGWDGYVATGGTESNIQGLWLARNGLRAELGSPALRVGVLRSADTHYSIPKAADLLGLVDLPVPVDPTTRQMTPRGLERALGQALDAGVGGLAVVLNMGTTMFGSVDRPAPVWAAVDASGLPAVGHVDAAFGGFVYPFTAADGHGAALRAQLDFRDPRLRSFTLDAHKMLQAPYGTGIHLCRRGWIEHARTPDAAYVEGGDVTLCGSRSGANAVAVWMILRAWGSEGGAAFCADLLARTDRLCRGLAALGVAHFREPGMNVVALAAEAVPPEVAERFSLVPDRHDAPRWLKVVVMDHVGDAAIDALLAEISLQPGARQVATVGVQ